MFGSKKMEKGCCELCSKPARMYCDSDQARLCWDCDEKVHSANFLVAKHSRSLLCHVCQSPTPWKASGTKLGPTISVCESCFDNSTVENPATRMRIRRHEQEEEAQDETESLGDGYSESGNDDEYSDFDDYDEDEDDEEIEEVEDDEEDGENQVVPWSSCPTPSSSAPPLTTSSSSEHGSFSTRDGAAAVSSALKRSRDNRHLDSDDEDVSCSSQVNLNTGAMENRRACFRSLKMARAEEEEEDLVHRPETETELRRRRRMELLGSFMSFQQTTAGNLQHNNTSSEVIRRISKLSRDAL